MAAVKDNGGVENSAQSFIPAVGGYFNLTGL